MDGSPAARGELVPLRRNRDFVLLQIGQALSTVGSEASGIAYTLLVLALTGSPAKAGLAGFARLVPYALFALPAGVASDRFNRKWLMIWADVVRVLALGSLALTIATGHVSLAQVLLVAFIEGTMFVIFNIAEIGAVRSVVPAAQLQSAFATEQARMSTVYLVGPPLGGALFGLARSLPFLVDAVSCVLDRNAPRHGNAFSGGAGRVGNRGRLDADQGRSCVARGAPVFAHLRA